MEYFHSSLVSLDVGSRMALELVVHNTVTHILQFCVTIVTNVIILYHLAVPISIPGNKSLFYVRKALR